MMFIIDDGTVGVVVSGVMMPCLMRGEVRVLLEPSPSDVAQSVALPIPVAATAAAAEHAAAVLN